MHPSSPTLREPAVRPPPDHLFFHSQDIVNPTTGVNSYSATFSGFDGWYVTATCTRELDDELLDTSEFSNAVLP
jgi:hypothetical protein